MKKLIIYNSLPIISVLIISLLFSILNLFSISIHPIIYTLLSVIIFFASGILNDTYKEKVLLKNIIYIIIIAIIMYLLSFIFLSKHNINNLIYYIIIIISYILGTIVKISKKND